MENNEQNYEEENKEFSSELQNQNTNLNADEFAQKQEEYRQMLNNEPQQEDIDPFVWRVGFGRRLGAYLLDYLFYFLLLVIALVITGILDEMLEIIPTDSNLLLQNMQQVNDFIIRRFTPLTLAITFVYFSMEVIFAQSLGKMAFGIVIGTQDKKFATIRRLVGRFVLKFSGTLFSLLVLLTSLDFLGTLSSILSAIIFIGCFFALGEKKLALHDRIAGTAVYFKDELLQLDSKVNGQY